MPDYSEALTMQPYGAWPGFFGQSGMAPSAPTPPPRIGAGTQEFRPTQRPNYPDYNFPGYGDDLTGDHIRRTLGPWLAPATVEKYAGEPWFRQYAQMQMAQPSINPQQRILPGATRNGQGQQDQGQQGGMDMARIIQLLMQMFGGGMR